MGADSQSRAMSSSLDMSGRRRTISEVRDGDYSSIYEDDTDFPPTREEKTENEPDSEAADEVRELTTYFPQYSEKTRLPCSYSEGALSPTSTIFTAFTTPQRSIETLRPPRPQTIHFGSAQSLDEIFKPEWTPLNDSFGSVTSFDHEISSSQIGTALIDQTIGAYHHPDNKSESTLVGAYHEKWQAAEPPKVLELLPKKKAIPFARRVRHNLWNVYQRLFTIVVLGNLIALVTIMIQHRHSKPFGPNLANIATATAANITGAILMRQEHVINALYTILCWTPHSTPLRIRRVIAKFYHFGGVHSSCSVAATVWFVLYTVLLTKQYVDHDFRHVAVLVMTYLLVALLLLICFFAIPRFRFRSHNTFEAMHRFGGWLAVGLFWAEIMLVSVFEAQATPGQSLNAIIVKTPAFWFLILITWVIIFPWLKLRKVQAWPEVLSKSAVRIHFNYAVIGTVMGIRIANSPLKEWHPFATIPEADGSSFSIIVSRAGDWTQKQIEHPAYSYWVRGIPISGVLRMAVVFKRVVVVTTGSGIGPCLSLLIAHPLPCRILWSSPNPREIYGEGTIQAVMAADPDAMIINTKTTGRPDMVGLTYHLYKQSGAEAVFIISNIALTRKVVYAMESRGVPAYGPIWDS